MLVPTCSEGKDWPPKGFSPQILKSSTSYPIKDCVSMLTEMKTATILKICCQINSIQ